MHHSQFVSSIDEIDLFHFIFFWSDKISMMNIVTISLIYPSIEISTLFFPHLRIFAIFNEKNSKGESIEQLDHIWDADKKQAFSFFTIKLKLTTLLPAKATVNKLNKALYPNSVFPSKSETHSPKIHKFAKSSEYRNKSINYR